MCFINYLLCNFNVGLWLGTGTSRMHRWRMCRPRCPFVAGARLRSSQTPFWLVLVTVTSNAVWLLVETDSKRQCVRETRGSLYHKSECRDLPTVTGSP